MVETAVCLQKSSVITLPITGQLCEPALHISECSCSPAACISRYPCAHPRVPRCVSLYYLYVSQLPMCVCLCYPCPGYRVCVYYHVCLITRVCVCLLLPMCPIHMSQLPYVSRLAACVSLLPTCPSYGVCPTYQCSLLQTCMGKDVTLHVSASNSAMLLYQKFGFKAEEYILDFYDKYHPLDSKQCKHAFLLRLRR